MIIVNYKSDDEMKIIVYEIVQKPRKIDSDENKSLKEEILLLKSKINFY